MNAALCLHYADVVVSRGATQTRFHSLTLGERLLDGLYTQNAGGTPESCLAAPLMPNSYPHLVDN